MRKCRFCAKDIQDAAVACPHCGKDLITLPTTAPIEPAAAAPALVPLAAQVPAPASTQARVVSQPVEQTGGSTNTGDDDAA